ncbi:MAG: sugar phosphate isomerase/epimerase family protein [Bacteroidales bacterium]
MTTSRRRFIRAGSAAVAGTLAMSALPYPLKASAPGTVSEKRNKSFGFQVWTIREELNRDFAATLRKMAALGYSEVEMCSPLGYSDSGFEPLNHMSGTEMRKIVEGEGLRCTSSHYNMGELRDHLENRIEWASQLGMKQMVASSFGLHDGASVEEYRKAAQELNSIAEKTRTAGIQMGYHNHHMEFEKRGDELIYDALMEEFDPELVKMQFQVAVVNIGYQAADYFRKYPGRFLSAHLADWSTEKEEQVPLGEGIVDWKDFFKAAKKGGVQNYFVEMDPDTFPESAEFLLETM